MLKLRGVLPWVDWWPALVSRPVLGSMRKMAMLSWPRLEPYRNLPEGWTTNSAVELLPWNPWGSVEIVCSSFSAPVSGSYWNAVTVELISLITYAVRPFGWKAKWRGPEPGATEAN